MKTAIWIVFSLAFALWTGLMSMTVQLGEWLVAAFQSGQTMQLLQTPEQWPIPAWLSAVIDPALVQAVSVAKLGFIEWLDSGMASDDGLIAWISRVTWGLWATGGIAMVAFAAGLNWLTSRQPSTPSGSMGTPA
jgi:hypothetical protein